jgi:serine protease Do
MLDRRSLSPTLACAAATALEMFTRVAAMGLMALMAAVTLSVLGALPAHAQQAPDPTAPPPASATKPADIVVAPAPVSSLGRTVLDKAQPSVVQIRAYFGDNTAKASHGSGFVVGEGALAITNYHVVSDYVMYPDRYRLEYRTPEQKKGRVEILSIDVMHDLALVRLVDHKAPALTLAADVPGKGDRAYSVGYPLDVGLTITEGVSNGLVEEAFEERLHYAGAINGGMSGGPAFDAQGRVIGVNVSAYRFQQNVSFLVPAKHAIELYTRRGDTPLDMKQARKEVSMQLQRHARKLLDALPKTLPYQTVHGVQFPEKLASFFDCGASGNPERDQAVQTQNGRCAAKAGIYVGRGMVSGDIEFSHQWMSTEKLGAWRFARTLTVGGWTGMSGNWGPGRNMVGPRACRQRFVDNQGIDMIATVCARAHKKFDDLFDFTLDVTSSHEPKRAFRSSLQMSGMPFDLGLVFVERYLASIRPAQAKDGDKSSEKDSDKDKSKDGAAGGGKASGEATKP